MKERLNLKFLLNKKTITILIFVILIISFTLIQFPNTDQPRKSIQVSDPTKEVTPIELTRKDELILNMQKWAESEIESYEITTRYVSDWDHTYTFVVYENEIAAVSAICGDPKTGTPCSELYYGFEPDLFTVPELFNEILKYYNNPKHEYMDPEYLRLHYSSTYGYPTRISFDHPEVYDEEYTISVTSFNIIDDPQQHTPGFPSPTPYSPGLNCESFKIGTENKFEISDLDIDSEGSVWVSTYGDGIYQYFPIENTWKNHTISDGLASNYVNSISLSNEGDIWAAIEGGISRFDGTSWQSWTTSDGLVSNNVYSLDFDSNGVVWIGTRYGISSFNPTTDEWLNYTSYDGLPDDNIVFVKVTFDDNIWFATSCKGTVRFFPTSATSQTYNWITYSIFEFDLPKEQRVSIDFVQDIEIAPDGSYWFAGIDLIQYFPEKNSWREIMGSNDFSWISDFEFSENGSIWIVPSKTEPLIIKWDSPNERFSLTDLRYYDTRDGIPSASKEDEVIGIEFASDGSLWITTHEDLSRCIILNQ